MSDATCTVCGSALERMRYFPRELITADDMRAEQEYFVNKMRRHNRFLHGWGVVCGCNVVPKPTDGHPWQVQVCPGYVVAPQGDDILINDCITFDLQTGMQPCDPCSVTYPCPPQPVYNENNDWTTAYLAVRYVECLTRPVRVHPGGCGCDEMDCEYSRIREVLRTQAAVGVAPITYRCKKMERGVARAGRRHRSYVRGYWYDAAFRPSGAGLCGMYRRSVGCAGYLTHSQGPDDGHQRGNAAGHRRSGHWIHRPACPVQHVSASSPVGGGYLRGGILFKPISVLIGVGSRRRSASQAIDLPSDGGAHCLINNVTGELTVRSGAAIPNRIGIGDGRTDQHGYAARDHGGGGRPLSISGADG